MHIGLVGGIGPAATDYYYRRMFTAFVGKNRSLDLTIVHADISTLLTNLAGNDVQAQVDIYQRLVDRLASAGAECVAIASIAGHFCIDTFKSVSPLPVVDMIDSVRLSIRQSGYQRVGILGTRTVMESRLYGGMEGIDIVPPLGDDLRVVSDSYVALATSGAASDAQRTVFNTACARLIREARVEAIVLAGTDLTAVFDEETSAVPLIDCASLHVQSILRYAITHV